MRVTNVSGVDREISHPEGFFASVAAGEDVEVPDDVGASLLEQPDNWAPAGRGGSLSELTKDELLELAEARGVDVAKSASKAEIIAAINKES